MGSGSGWARESHGVTFSYSSRAYLVGSGRMLVPLGATEVVEGVVGGLIGPEAVEEDGEFAGDGDDGTFLGFLGAACSKGRAVAAEVAVLAEATEDVLSAADEEFAHEWVAGFADAEFGVAVAGLLAGADELLVSGQAVGEAQALVTSG